MGSTEILVYVCVASLGLGFVICWLLFVIPAHLEMDALRVRNTARGLQQIRDDMDRVAYLHELRTEHKGTPYTKETLMYATLGKMLAEETLADNDRWSRKAPELKVAGS